MQHISVQELKRIIHTPQDPGIVDFINVCTPAEYKEKHIQGVRSVPLDEIESHLPEFEGKQTIYVHCRSGNRSQKAIQKLQDLGLTAKLINVEGGLIAWEAAGFKTGKLTSVKIPLMQQVLLVTGILVLFGSLSSVLFHVNFLWLTILVGVGLIFAGLTGWCGMAYVLIRMPWNN